MLEITKKYREQIISMTIALDFYNEIIKTTKFIEINNVEEEDDQVYGWEELDFQNKLSNKKRSLKCF
jgi:hypothetical protein